MTLTVQMTANVRDPVYGTNGVLLLGVQYLLPDDYARELVYERRAFFAAADIGAGGGQEAVTFDRATGALTPDGRNAVNGPQAMVTGQWQAVGSFCMVALTGSGSYTYDTQDAAGAITTGVGSGSAPDTVPIYMGGAVKLRFNFPSTAAAKVN